MELPSHRVLVLSVSSEPSFQFLVGIYQANINPILDAEGLVLEVVDARLRIFLFTPDTRTMYAPFGDAFTR